MRIRWTRPFAVAAMVVVLCLPSFAIIPVSPLVLARIGKMIWDALTFRHRIVVPPPNVKLNPDQIVDIAGLSSATASQKVDNWARPAGVETILPTHNVDLTHTDWVTNTQRP